MNANERNEIVKLIQPNILPNAVELEVKVTEDEQVVEQVLSNEVVENIDEELVKSINNLDGQKINECCGCCCEPCCGDVKCCDPYSYPKYFSESEIVSMLRNTPKIQNIWDIHYQFSNRYRFPGITLEETKENFLNKLDSLKEKVGHELIVTDGTTLLGGDDKAGIAAIMTMLEYFYKKKMTLNMQQ